MISAPEVSAEGPDSAPYVAEVSFAVLLVEFNRTATIQPGNRRNVTVDKLETASTLGSRTIARFFETNVQ